MPNQFAFLKGAAQFFRGPRIDAEPRKGAVPMTGGMVQANRSTDGYLVKDRMFAMPSRQYRQLAERDDIIAAIRRTLRFSIGAMEWKISPDMDAIKADLKRWQAIVQLRLEGIEVGFQPQALDPVFFAKASGALADLLRDEEADADDGDLENNQRIRQFFEHCLTANMVVAESHITRVKSLFDMPEPTAPDKSHRTLIDEILDDLTLFDGAALIKNPTMDGTRLAEIYTQPGDQIRLYRRKDRGTPVPPNIAFDWFTDGQIRSVYNSAELAYFCTNPQKDGYGHSPLDAILDLMMVSLYADAYTMDFFANNNTPRGVFDLGPNVDQPERDAVEARWNSLARAGIRRIMFVSNHDNVKGFIPMPSDSNKDIEIISLQQKWAARKCAAFGLSLNDIGFTEDLHRTTAETQQEMTQSRGVDSFCRIIDERINNGIVKGMMWVRDDPENPNCITGRVVPCFPFSDVKYEHIYEKTEDNDKDVEAHVSMVKAGILTINEVRKERGEPSIPGGDIAVVFDGTPMKVSDLKEIPPPQPPPDPNAMGGPPGAGGPPKPGQPQQQGGGPPQQQGKPGQQALPPGKTAKSFDSLVKQLDALVAGD